MIDSVKSGFSRRQLLKGLAATSMLPLMGSQKLFAAQVAPVRVLCVVLQHGWGLSGKSNQSMDVTSSTEFSFPDGLSPFNSIKQHANVIDGLMTLGEWGNNHDLSYADILTAGVPHGEESSSFDGHMPLSVTPSIDYLLQEASGLPSFRFSAGYQSWGVQYHPLSFAENSELLPYFTTAVDAYDSIFKGLPDPDGTPSGPAITDSEALLTDQILRSVQASGEVNLADLGAERSKIERYLSALEYVRQKNTVSTSYSGSERLQNIPNASQNSLQDLDNYFEMVKVGFANNITSSAVIGIGDINSIARFHHDHAHGNKTQYWNTRRQFAEKVVSFVQQLSQIQDFDGRSLLDNTLILLTGEVGDGTHGIVEKGNVLFGGGGHIPTGRYMKPERLWVNGARNRTAILREDRNGALQEATRWSTYASSRTNADLLREIGNIAGLNLTEFGLSALNRGDVLFAS